MLTRNLTLAFLSVMVLMISGCAVAPQTPIPLGNDYLKARTDAIGVAMSAVPKPGVEYPGAGCLLCLMTASVANKSLADAVPNWPTDELASLKGELLTLLSRRGQTVRDIEGPLNVTALPDRAGVQPGFARKDFSSLRARGVERVLVVDLKSVGVWRNYAAYVPTGAPQAILKAEVYIVDLATHRLDWYQVLDLSRVAEGNWDEPPKFPGLANAYFQVMEEGKGIIRQTLAR